MREIKFRAWDITDKEMCSVTGLHFFEGGDLDSVSVDDEDGEFQGLTVKRFEIMQYTGLKDDNGVEIFEGDIIRGHRGALYICKFNSGSFICSGKHYDVFFGDLFYNEVIGNIYENPELLKQTK